MSIEHVIAISKIRERGYRVEEGRARRSTDGTMGMIDRTAG